MENTEQSNNFPKILNFCAHLSKSVNIYGVNLSELKNLVAKRAARRRVERSSNPAWKLLERSNQLKSGKPEASKGAAEDDEFSGDEGFWNCMECGTALDSYICLSCGLIHCGNTANGDALKHYTWFPNHPLAMDCHHFKIFCYECDGFIEVGDDDDKIEAIRDSLHFYNIARDEDHNYAIPIYDPSTDPEEIIEISFNESPPQCYDDSTEDECDGQKGGKDSGSVFPSVFDALEVQVGADVEIEDTNNCGYALERSSHGSFQLGSSSSEQSEKVRYSGASEPDTTQSLVAQDTVVIPKSVKSTVSLQDRFFAMTGRILRSQTVKCYGNNSDGLFRCSASTTALSASQIPSTSSQQTTAEGKNLRGLKNLGNTCFMNAVIQSLNSVDIFRYFMRRLPLLEMDASLEDPVSPPVPRYRTRSSLPQNCDKSSPHTLLSEELRKTIVELSKGSGSSDSVTNYYAPEPLLGEVWKQFKRFRGFQQHDAHEFLRCVLDQMHLELKDCNVPDWLLSEVCEGGVRVGNASHFLKNKNRKRTCPNERPCAISAMFEGALESHVTCLTCGTVSHKQDPFFDLSLDFFVNGRLNASDLDECLREFFHKEELLSCDQYTCERCSEKCPSTKQLFIRTLPSILVVHLKRFRWSQNCKSKLVKMIKFPISGLQMKDFLIQGTQGTGSVEGNDDGKSIGSESRSNSFSSCSSVIPPPSEGSTVYDLASIVVHHGTSLSSGHYTAFGRRDGVWYQFNDISVKQCTEEIVEKQKAYLLLYTRRTGL